MDKAPHQFNGAEVPKSEQEARKAREEKFNTAQDKLNDYLDQEYPRKEYNIFESLDSQEISKFSGVKEELRAKLNALADLAMDGGTQVSTGVLLLNSLGRIDEIKERIAKGVVDSKGHCNWDLITMTFRYGTPEQMSAAVKYTIEHEEHVFLHYSWRSIFRQEDDCQKFIEAGKAKKYSLIDEIIKTSRTEKVDSSK